MKEVGLFNANRFWQADGDGAVMRCDFFNVPAGSSADHGDFVAPGVEALNNEVHIDPMAAIHREHQNPSSMDTWTCHEGHTHEQDSE